MKKAVASLMLALSFASTAYAACTTSTYFINGRTVVCTTCCHGNTCNTHCN